MTYSKCLLFVRVAILAALCVVPIAAQETESTGSKGGKAVGSYQLDNFDTVNLFNGNLNFSIPLLKVGGRGEAGISVPLTIERRWETQAYGAPGVTPTYTIEPKAFAGVIMYGAGKLTENVVGSQFYEPNPISCGTVTYQPNYAKLILNFATSDGTTYQFRSTANNGAPYNVPGCWPGTQGYNHGKEFITWDGSGVKFVSDVDIKSHVAISSATGYLTGYIMFPNGTRYRVVYGLVQWIQDRNGNRVNIEYTSEVVSKITDSVGREITFEYGLSGSPYGGHTKVTYKGFDNTARIIRISYDSLANVLRTDASTLTMGEGFTQSPEAQEEFEITGTVVSAVWLPDGRKYNFEYNGYAELARVELPTGGAYEYDYWGDTPPPPNNGECPGPPYRRVSERRVYADGSTLSQKTTFSSTVSGSPAVAVTTVDVYDGSSNRISRQKHYFHEDPVPTNPLIDPGLFNDGELDWNKGREFKTELYAANGSTLMRTVETPWEAGKSHSWNPYGTGATTVYRDARTTSVTTTLEDTDQVSQVTYAYDAYATFNLQTDVREYDFGSGSPGSLLRRTHTEFEDDAAYTDELVNLVQLPVETWVSSDDAGSNIVSRTKFEYDNYTEDTYHDDLVPRLGIFSHDASFDDEYTTRGNVTKVTRYKNADAETGPIYTYAQYDIAGNVVKTIDAKNYVTTIGYDDNFGVPDTALDSEADGDYVDEEVEDYLGESHTFAFPTSSTNPKSWTAYVQYDYFLGMPVNTQDVNGMKSKMVYNDPLDRPTQTAKGLTTASEIQTTIAYDDDLGDRTLTAMSDLNTVGDNLLKTVSIYDGLGRTKENRTYETGGGYRAVETQFDPLSRPYKVSNPFRSGDTKYWTETTFDALGRPVQVETLDDDATVITAYDGNRTIVTDQAGKQRIILTNALGHLKDIWEIRPSSDGSTVSVSFPGGAYSGIAYGYKTSYGYDTLGNLTSVDQGSVDRSFTYDSLSRLLSANNPESGVVEYEYDNNSNLVERTDARGIVTTNSYDELNRITAKAYATPSPTPANYQNTPSVAYTYDNLTNSKGHLTKVETSVSTTEYTEFDILGRVTKSKQTTDGTTYGNGSTDSYMTYSYNLAGILIEQQYPSGRKVQNVLDNDGQLEMVKSRKNANSGYWAYANNISYAASGAIKSMQLGNGTWESTVFNNRLQPTQIALGTVKDGYDKLKLNYSYGDWSGGSIVASKNNGNIAQQVITTPNSPGETDAFTATQKYYYDSLNRIDDSVETVSGETWQQDFDYDRYGNRTFVEANTDFNGFLKECTGAMCTELKKRLNPAIGSANRLSTSDDYAFDSSGNTTENPDDRQFIYDGENKQVKVLDDQDETIGEYWYDGDGKRVKKFAPPAGGNPGEVTVFVYDAFGKQIAEYSVDIETTNAKVAYVTNDHLGSPRINTDKNGGVTARHDYHPFGEEIVTSNRDGHAEYAGDKIRKQFTGYERDAETDLDYAQARYYSPRHGRFASADPLASSSDVVDPQTFNRYIYVTNNPLNSVDPSGLAECSAEFSYAQCGGGSGHTFGDDYAMYYDIRNLSANMRQDLLNYEYRVSNAFYGQIDEDAVAFFPIHYDDYPEGDPQAADPRFSGGWLTVYQVMPRVWQVAHIFRDVTAPLIELTNPYHSTITNWISQELWGTNLIDTESRNYENADTVVAVGSLALPGGAGKYKAANSAIKHRKLIKNIVRNASKPGVTLSDAKIAQLERVVKKAGGNLRTERGLRGTMNGIKHSQVEGFGPKVAHRHIIHANQK